MQRGRLRVRGEYLVNHDAWKRRGWIKVVLGSDLCTDLRVRVSGVGVHMSVYVGFECVVCVGKGGRVRNKQAYK